MYPQEDQENAHKEHNRWPRCNTQLQTKNNVEKVQNQDIVCTKWKQKENRNSNKTTPMLYTHGRTEQTHTWTGHWDTASQNTLK